MRALVLVAAALALAVPAVAAPPRRGVLLPGERLGGVALGTTAAQLHAAWGARHGVCRSCGETTWYFNFRPFEPQGAGVELHGGRVAAVFTLWAPPGWRTSRGLRIGEDAARVTAVYGPLTRIECGGYYALTLPRGRTTTAFYVVDGELWGFGLLRDRLPVCR